MNPTRFYGWKNGKTMNRWDPIARQKDSDLLLGAIDVLGSPCKNTNLYLNRGVSIYV